MRKNGLNPMFSDHFSPKEAHYLYTFDKNAQYHLNGRSILGIQRKWNLEKIDGKYKLRHGCSINPGSIQSDHSGWMNGGCLEKTFIEAKNVADMLDITRNLLNLSNEEMARKFWANEY